MKMPKTAAKQSPGQDANIFMLITWEEGKDAEKYKSWLVPSGSEGDGEWEQKGGER